MAPLLIALVALFLVAQYYHEHRVYRTKRRQGYTPEEAAEGLWFVSPGR